jgi:transglutaminase-like putative cysteine protease
MQAQKVGQETEKSVGAKGGRFKRLPLIALGVAAGLALLLFTPGLPWSAHFRHKLRRAAIKAEMTVARWRGYEPRFMSIAGKIEAGGASIHLLDSRSGWATLSDAKGNFILPGVMWYPEADYDLVISTDGLTGTLMKVSAPAEYPESGLYEIGRLDTARGEQAQIDSIYGINSFTDEEFDRQNGEYYRETYERVTAGKGSDEEKIDAINRHVASMLNYDETQWELGSPRRILETGSQYCGHLATAMQTLLAVGGFRARALHLSDGAEPPGTHAVVEVFHDGSWHLYDPTFGIKYLNAEGKIASYNEVRLDPSLITEEHFARYKMKERLQWVSFMRGVYETGFHHFYYLKDAR